jgi:CRP/FNR family transcriptional regulator, cyclic AMP receptor protein
MRKVFYIFGLLTDADIDWIAPVGIRRRVKSGETLIEQGKPIDSIILVLEGRFSVIVKDVGVIARRHAGDLLGEMSIVDSAPPSATVVVEGECRVLSLNKNILLQKARNGHGIRMPFLQSGRSFSRGPITRDRASGSKQ